MSLNEILAIGFGLFIGYWLVSKLFSGAQNGAKPKAQSPKDTGPEEAQYTYAPPPEPGVKTWYEELKVSPTASVTEIQQAYKSLIRQYHPDKVATLGEELRALAEEKSKAINAAYQTALNERGG